MGGLRDTDKGGKARVRVRDWDRGGGEGNGLGKTTIGRLYFEVIEVHISRGVPKGLVHNHNQPAGSPVTECNGGRGGGVGGGPSKI